MKIKLPMKYRVDFMAHYPYLLPIKLKLGFVRNGTFYFNGSFKGDVISMDLSVDEMENINFDLEESVENLIGCNYINLYINGMHILRIQ